MDYPSLCSLSGMCKVWTAVSSALRDVKDRISRVQDSFYGHREAIDYLADVYNSLKSIFDRSKLTPRMCTILELESRMKDVTSGHGRNLSDSIEVVREFICRFKATTDELLAIYHVFQSEVAEQLTLYCSDYCPLGVSDDQFYKTLISRTRHIKDNLADYCEMCKLLKQNYTIDTSLFCDDKLSQEVAIELNCDTYQVLRIVPDLIQKLETSFDIAHDWLRSDRVYVSEAQQQIEKTNDKLKFLENHKKLTKLDYDKTYTQLKHCQLEYDAYSKASENIQNELSKLEVRKTRLQMEILAVSKTLKTYRENVKGCPTVNKIGKHEASSSDDISLDGDVDEIDGEALISDRPGHAQSSHRTRVFRDTRAHAVKLKYLRDKLRKICRRISHNKRILMRYNSLDDELKILSRRLRSIGRKKNKISEKKQTLNEQLTRLQKALHSRHTSLRPASITKSEIKATETEIDRDQDHDKVDYCYKKGMSFLCV